MDLSTEANGVMPIPAPTRTPTSKLNTSCGHGAREGRRGEGRAGEESGGGRGVHEKGWVTSCEFAYASLNTSQPKTPHL